MTTITATVAEVIPLGDEIKSFRLTAPDAPFAAASAGAHIDVFLPNGLIRQYSLWDWDADGDWGSVGVKDEPEGRGGSHWLHENLAKGATVDIGAVRNNFALDETGDDYILIAGGIGVTPLVPMARRLKRLGKPFTFHYAARSDAAAGFAGILDDLGLGEDLRHHRDDRDGTFDAARAVATRPDAQIYVCGPEPMLLAVLAASGDGAGERVRFERFSNELIDTDGPAGSFEIVLAKSDATLEVPEHLSILDVLIDAGYDPDFGCMDGVCASCTTSVLEGEVEHRDATKDAAQHDADGTMCICVSRAKGTRLVLDF